MAFLAGVAATVSGSGAPTVERIESYQRLALIQMLGFVRERVKARYYDPQLHGVDLDARYEQAKQMLKNGKVDTLNGAFGLAAWLVEPLNDRHTLFIPPAHPYRVENGFRKKFFASRCYITAVEPGSDPAAQGIHAGDQVLGIEDMRVERDSAWKIDYSFELLSPRSALHMLIAAPHAAPREVRVKAQVKKLPGTVLVGSAYVGDPDDVRMQSSAIIELSERLMIWRLPAFVDEIQSVDSIMAKARKHEALILDLRGNPGGEEGVLTHLIGSVCTGEVQIAKRVGRNGEQALIAKASGAKKQFAGKLVVLVDSDSASASELFARVMQLEKRGIVVGDRTAGAVMEARFYPDQVGDSSFHFGFAVEITERNLIMADGKSLEHMGVTPDETILPSAEDLAAGRDPVLARAAQLAGEQITPEKARTLLPTLWYSKN